MNHTELSASCPACHSNQIREEWPTRRIGGKKKILWCAACNFGWQHPLPTPTEIHDYYCNFPAYNIHGANEKEASSLKRINRINQLMPNRGRLLDIGSGLGYFLKTAQKDGWNVTGLEPQKSAALHCQNQLGIKVHTENIEKVKLDRASFDVVTLWDVWEHVHDPFPFLDRCISLLSPDGLLVMAIPNAAGIPARIFKGQWRYVMHTHLSYFTLSYIRQCLAERGLLVEKSYHTIKIQSLLQGVVSWLPFPIDTERIIRLGRRGSIEHGRPEQVKTNERLEQLPVLTKLLGLIRRLALTINLTPLPGPYGDLMDLYCRKKLP